MWTCAAQLLQACSRTSHARTPTRPRARAARTTAARTVSRLSLGLAQRAEPERKRADVRPAAAHTARSQSPMTHARALLHTDARTECRSSDHHSSHHHADISRATPARPTHTCSRTPCRACTRHVGAAPPRIGAASHSPGINHPLTASHVARAAREIARDRPMGAHHHAHTFTRATHRSRAESPRTPPGPRCVLHAVRARPISDQSVTNQHSSASQLPPPPALARQALEAQ